MMTEQKAKQRMYLTAESMYKFLLGMDDKIDTLVLCRSSEVHLITTDQSIYEAIGSIEDKSKINFNKLVKLMEVTEIVSFAQSMKKPRTILTDKRVDDIRGLKKEISNEIDNAKKRDDQKPDKV